jgi:hypothetical protein
MMPQNRARPLSERRERRLSAEARVLLSPAATFRELIEDERGGSWVFVRRPLLLALALGCTVSMLTSSRLSARFIVDGAISFAFVPIFEVMALAIVYRLAPRRIPFSRAVDLLCAANGPWLLWLIALGAVCCLQSPRDAAIWTPRELGVALALSIPVIAWSAYLDLNFFREILPRRAGAARDAVLLRAIFWPCALVYFLGYAIWPEIVGRIAG